VLLGLVGPATSAGQQTLTPVERARLAAALWSEAHYNYAGRDRVRADLDSGIAALLGQAAQRQPDLLYYRRLRRFVALLNDGQAAVIPPSRVAVQLARPPLALVSVEGRPFITDYTENDETSIARPERLAEVVSVQGIPADQWIRDSILPEIGAGTADARWDRAVAHLLDGERGTALQLQLQAQGMDARGASLTRTIAEGAPWPFDPPALAIVRLQDSTAVLHLSSFSDPEVIRQIDHAFPTWDGVHGLIIDLRDNSGTGGGREIAYQLLARLASKPFVGSRWQTAVYRPLYRSDEGGADSSFLWLAIPPDTIQPRQDKPRFTGPVAVLASSRTAGAAEDFLAAFRNAGRGTIVGHASAGATGQVSEIPLYRDWRLRVTITREELPDRTEINGRGLAPDIKVDEKVSEFQAGTDAVLDRARAWIVEQRVRH